MRILLIFSHLSCNPLDGRPGPQLLSLLFLHHYKRLPPTGHGVIKLVMAGGAQYDGVGISERTHNFSLFLISLIMEKKCDF